MAKIFRFSGYFIEDDCIEHTKSGFKNALIDCLIEKFMLRCKTCAVQQLHVEESDYIKNINGELDIDCDLSLLTRHFKNVTTLEYDRSLPQKGEKYRHFKIGKIVTVIGISRHTETEEVLVVYDCGESGIWSRPLDMFMSEVDHEKYPDAEQKYRFEKIED